MSISLVKGSLNNYQTKETVVSRDENLCLLPANQAKAMSNFILFCGENGLVTIPPLTDDAFSY